jgi:hypothetical protein
MLPTVLVSDIIVVVAGGGAAASFQLVVSPMFPLALVGFDALPLHV